jgi:proteasome beta subunit
MEDEIKKYVLKTGTLTVGIVCKDGIVIGADNRVTYGGDSGVSYIAGELTKIKKINERIIVTIAGVASDALRSIKLVSAEIKLKELRDKREISIREAASLMSNILFQNIRTPSMILSIAHFLIAGYDESGAYLYDAGPAGDLKEIKDYAATGAPFESLGIFDVEYKKSITTEEGIKLAKKVFESTRGRQPGVGDGFDIYIVKPGEIKQVSSEKVSSQLVKRE